jgi:hypothetical protein
MTDQSDLESETAAATIEFQANVLIGETVEFLLQPGRIDQLNNLRDVCGLIIAGKLDRFEITDVDATVLAVAVSLAAAVTMKLYADRITKG